MACSGYYRMKGHVTGRKGGLESRGQFVTNRVVSAAEIVHTKGIAQWLDFTKK